MQELKRNISYIGVHIVADFWGAKIIESSRELKILLADAAKKGKNTFLKFALHKFSPRGITGVALLSESHISFHTWPEFEYTAIDIFTCGIKSKPEEALEFLKKELRPKSLQVRIIKRGRRIGKR